MSDFTNIYQALADVVDDLAGGEFKDFEDISVVEQDGTQLSRKNLMSIKDDNAFVRNCFYKLMGRNPRPDEVRNFGGQISTGKMTRQGMIEKILGSPEYEKKDMHVRLV